MGIVIRQSVTNTIITYIGFAIGAANALFLYPAFLGEKYYGLTAFILSASNILMPLMAFGVHNTIVKFYSGYRSEKERAGFFTFMLILPLGVAIPASVLGIAFYGEVASLLSVENPIIYDFVWQVPVIAICMGYYEIFYAWVKVQLQSVFGNFVKEVFLRLMITVFLIAVYFDIISPEGFIYATMAVYLAATLAMVGFAMRVRLPRLVWKTPTNAKSLVVYSLFIIMAGSVANLLLDIDRTMLGQYISIENIAYYSVAVFIATTVSVPQRSMHQITYPITAKLMSEAKHSELNVLYKKTSLTLQIVGGYVLLGILVNIKMVYELLPDQYSGGIFVVFAIGLSKYFELMLGNNNAIIFNSKYYKIVLVLGLLLAISAIGLNAVLIPLWGINGAAIATLSAIFLYSAAKLMFVIFKMNLFPFTWQTLYVTLLSVLMWVMFYFWDFDYQPLANIILKSVLLTGVYGYSIYITRLSEDVNGMIRKAIRFARRQ